MKEKQYRDQLLIQEKISFSRPLDQKKLIADLKRICLYIEQIEHNEIIELITNELQFLFEEVVMELAKLTYSDASAMAEKWSGYSNRDFRSKMYKLYKREIDGIVSKKAIRLKTVLPRLRRAIKEYSLKAGELNSFVEKNKKLYNQIDKKWYELLGGIKGRVDNIFDTEDRLKKGAKLKDQDIISSLLGIDFIKGQTHIYHDINAEYFMDSRLHRHALMDY
jgi:inorganic triphosphatase YgiF